MKRNLKDRAGTQGNAAGDGYTSSKRTLILRSLSMLVLLLAFVFVVQGQNTAKDPGPRTGTPGAGNFISGLTSSQQSYFSDGQTRFQEVETVQNGANIGLGPTFNSNQCSSCHAQPAVGGTSPSVNPQIAVANLDGAANTIPSFITLNGPVREARFKFATDSNGRLTNTPDGGVHGLFTIAGRSDATSCQLAQPNFERMVNENNVSFRIPTPTFGLGLIESITEDTIMANQAAESAGRQFLGVSGTPNRSGNDGSITRFGWKAQNKSLLMFSGEAYNVEMGITNELFPNERGYPPTPLAPGGLPDQSHPGGHTNQFRCHVHRRRSERHRSLLGFHALPRSARAVLHGHELLAVDPERQESLHQRGEVLCLPYTEYVYRHLIRRGAKQHPGESIFRFADTPYGFGAG